MFNADDSATLISFLSTPSAVKRDAELELGDVDRILLKTALCRLSYDEFLLTPYWRIVARSVKDRAGYRCQLCNSAKSLECHHRTYDHHGEEHLFIGDLTCLCGVCHRRFHGEPAKVKKPKKPRDPLSRSIRKYNRKTRKLLRKAASFLKIPVHALKQLPEAKVSEMYASKIMELEGKKQLRDASHYYRLEQWKLKAAEAAKVETANRG